MCYMVSLRPWKRKLASATKICSYKSSISYCKGCPPPICQGSIYSLQHLPVKQFSVQSELHWLAVKDHMTGQAWYVLNEEKEGKLTQHSQSEVNFLTFGLWVFQKFTLDYILSFPISVPWLNVVVGSLRIHSCVAFLGQVYLANAILLKVNPQTMSSKLTVHLGHGHVVVDSIGGSLYPGHWFQSRKISTQRC